MDILTGNIVGSTWGFQGRSTRKRRKEGKVVDSMERDG